MSMFRTILENELVKRHLSIREAAKQIGISHTTLIAAKEGVRSLDTRTMIKIALWLDVPLTEIVDEAPESDEKKASLRVIEIVLEAAPQLQEVFEEAASELEAGTLTLDDFRDIVEFTAYKIYKRRQQLGLEDQKISTLKNPQQPAAPTSRARR